MQFPCTVVENLCSMETTNYELMNRIRTQQRYDDALQALWEALNMTIMGGVQIDDRDAILYLVCLAKEDLKLEIVQNNRNLVLNHRLESKATAEIFPLNECQTTLSELLPKFSQELLAMSSKSFHDVITNFYHIESTTLKGKYGLIFDFLLQKFTSSVSRFGSEFINPSELSILVSAIAGIKKGTRVYNPFCGLGSFGVYLEGLGKYIGQDISSEACNIAKLRMVAHNNSEIATIIQGDSIHEWNPRNEDYDLIVAAPPFGIKVDDIYKDPDYENMLFEDYLLIKGLESLRSNGKIIAVVSSSFLFNTSGLRDIK